MPSDSSGRPPFHNTPPARHLALLVPLALFHLAYPKALNDPKSEGTLSQRCELRQGKYLTNLVEQDHRFSKHLVKPGLGCFSFTTAGPHPSGIRNQDHDQERADARRRKRAHQRTDDIHDSPVWRGNLS